MLQFTSGGARLATSGEADDWREVKIKIGQEEIEQQRSYSESSYANEGGESVQSRVCCMAEVEEQGQDNTTWH